MIKVLPEIEKRRSVRKYTPAKVEYEKLSTVLEAGRLAPSACNAQPWRFVVLQDLDKKNNFADEVFSGLYSNTKFAKDAPVIIAIVSNKGNFTSRAGNMIRKTEFYLIDLGITAQTMCLQAQNLGLGTCMLGWFDDKKAAKFLNLKSGEKCELLVALGYGAEAPAQRPRKEMNEIVEQI
ncbi:nitroreductase [Elusimicrobium posterum]|uniref:nitroreductase family protein n=1 Tax=Elusimicrobium posterum TaxID=3116653 RepID=UPI003C77D17A